MGCLLITGIAIYPWYVRVRGGTRVYNAIPLVYNSACGYSGSLFFARPLFFFFTPRDKLSQCVSHGTSILAMAPYMLE